MVDFETLHRRAVERILEDESLTADLTDEAALSLLNWGLAQVKALSQQAERYSPEELDSHIHVLRRTMKRIGHKAGQAQPEAQIERIQAMLTRIESGQNEENSDVA